MENQIISALEFNGYIFNNKADLYEFAKTKCVLEIRDNIKTLVVDGKPICQWDDKINISPIFEEDRQTKITATYGEFQILRADSIAP